MSDNLSKSALKKIRSQLEEKLKDCTMNRILPFLATCIKSEFPDQIIDLDLRDLFIPLILLTAATVGMIGSAFLIGFSLPIILMMNVAILYYQKGNNKSCYFFILGFEECIGILLF